MEKDIKEYDRSDMAAIVAAKLGVAKKVVMDVYKATAEEMPEALAKYKRIEIHGFVVADLKYQASKPYRIQRPTGEVYEGQSAPYYKLNIKAHRKFRVATQVAAGEKVK